jgi:hypothetical protein
VRASGVGGYRAEETRLAFNCCWLTGQVALCSIAAHVGSTYRFFLGPGGDGAFRTLSYWAPLTIICDSKFPLLVHARAGAGDLPKQQPKTKPMGVLCICCTR